VSTQTLQMALV